MENKTHIAVVPSPGFSHLVPIIEFSKRFIHLHPDFHVTCIIPTLGSPPSSSKAYLQSLPSNIHSVFLPPISEDVIPKDIYVGKKIQLTITKSLPSLLEVLKSFTSNNTPLAAIVADPFAFEALDFAKELNTLSFMYFSVSAMALFFFLYIPKLDQQISGEYRDSIEPIQLSGCVPIHGSDLPNPVQDRSSQVYKEYVERARRLSFIDGILVNSFIEMEEGAIRALEEEARSGGNPTVYPVGPITQTGLDKIGSNSDSECMRWLEKQPRNSVLYVSFGSGGTLSQHQINELAFGLEMSENKFLWVVRALSNSVSAAYLGSTNEDPSQFLPEGFLERTKEQGLVISSWAPQISILSHSSIGGFLSHCGWNSTLESIQHGVPLITWPLFAEQRMNACMLTNGLKVGLRPKVKDDGIVGRDEIAKVIKSLMEGEESKEIRKRTKDLRDSAISAVKEDSSSTKTMAKLAQKWKSFRGI